MSRTPSAELAASIERRIVDGDLPGGAKLEPVRSAAQRLGLAPNTVAAAYRLLAERGLVKGRGRHGTIVESRPRPTLIPEPVVPDGMVDLAFGGPDPALLPDLGPVLAGLDGSSATYGDPAVNLDLEMAARAALAAEGVEGRYLAVTGGAVDGIERALGASLRPGDAVGLEDPGWYPIVDLVRAMGLVPVPVAVDGEGMLPDRLAQVMGRVSAVIVTPRAQSPTGAALTPERAAALAALLAARPEVLVIDDDHMGPLAGAPLAAVGPQLSTWIYVHSFSKSLGPDLRTAVVLGDDVTMDRLTSRQMVGPAWVSHILQRTVAELLRSPDVARRQVEAADAYTERRRLFHAAMESHGMTVVGTTGFNLWVPVDDEDAAVRSARDNGFVIRAGSPFRHQSGPGVRVTVSQITADEADGVARALAHPPRRRTSRAV
ncbi:MAG TPA: aminotransferase class I/II-fold pyridoxal phosphate-dependent enzyme [Acidimicrobiia bacterium]|nr:aminotransferase class I/II-fold pyridoxal phosphate-dependent enzyme [Acidimicrobiia bacterium]